MAAQPRRIEFTVDPEFDGAKVWYVLERQLKVTRRTISRAKYMEDGICLDGVRCKVVEQVRAGQTISIIIGDTPADLAGSRVVPQEGPLSIAHMDEDLIVVDKPAGVATHPSRGHLMDTTANFLAHYLAKEDIQSEIHAVNRLDKGTSGLVVFSTSGTAQHRLQNLLHTSDFRRTYLAICSKTPTAEKGMVDAPIALAQEGSPVREVRADGKPARTHYQVLSSLGPDAPCFVRLVLETGRTHQIRVHMAHIGCSLIGDEMYGEPSTLLDRPALHSHMLHMRHPMTGTSLDLESPLPEDFLHAIEELGLSLG